MRLVIPYRNDGNNGHELRYCIRSMVKYFTPMSGVLLIGDKPTWYTGDHLPAQDIPGRKEWSIVSKILLCPDDVFLLCSDDVFALQPFEHALYHGDKLSNIRRNDRHGERIANVRKVFPDGYNYDIHTPMIVSRTGFALAHSLCRWDQREYLTKSVYGNAIKSGVQLPDCKIRNNKPDLSQPFVSSNVHTVRFLPLQEMYPTSSQWES